MILLFLYFTSLLTRLIFLFYGMPSITHDEADFFLNSYYLIKTGTDVFNNRLFLTSGHLAITGSIPVYIGSIFFLFFEKNIYLSRLPYAIISSFIPLFFYLLIKKLFKNNNNLALLNFFVLNFSPWFLHLSSQAAIEQITSLFFLISGFYFYLSNKKIIILLSYLSLFLSFHSYMGIKIVFLFFILIIFISKKLIYKKLTLKNLTILFIKSIIFYLILLISLFIFSNKNLLTQRANQDLIFLNKEIIENKVWYERLTSESPSLLKKIYFNKITILYRIFIEKYFDVFNLKTLFINGDEHPIYGNSYPLFYSWQIIFFLIGLSTFILNLTKNKILLIFLLIILFSPLPTALNIQPSTIALRSFPIIFAFSFLITYGFIYFYKSKKTFLYFFILLIIFSYLNFIYIYNSKIKIISSEQWHFSEKQLFDKIETLDKNKKIIILNNEPKETFLLYSFYKINNASLIKEKWQNKDYSFDNVYFTNNCPKKPSSNNLYLMKRETCKKEKYNLIPYLYANDKSGVIYYKIKNVL